MCKSVCKNMYFIHAYVTLNIKISNVSTRWRFQMLPKLRRWGTKIQARDSTIDENRLEGYEQLIKTQAGNLVPLCSYRTTMEFLGKFLRFVRFDQVSTLGCLHCGHVFETRDQVHHYCGNEGIWNQRSYLKTLECYRMYFPMRSQLLFKMICLLLLCSFILTTKYLIRQIDLRKFWNVRVKF